ncbi:MAG: endonuclease/exonuclease/phosphatase family protein [Polyangiales bacterium]
MSRPPGARDAAAPLSCPSGGCGTPRLPFALVGIASGLFVVAIVVAMAVAACRAQPGPAEAELHRAVSESASACEAFVARRDPARPPSLHRVATWNVRWFPRGRPSGREAATGTDVAWLACAIAALDVDVLAVQEFVLDAAGRAKVDELLGALRRHTGAEWKSAFDECPSDGRQHVGFLWNSSRVPSAAHRVLASVNPSGGACGNNLRPGLALEVELGGSRVTLVTAHLDSGTSERDSENRRRSYEALARETRRRGPVVVLGDLNTMGCEACTPTTSADDELAALERTMRPAGLRHLGTTPGCTEYSGSHVATLDHVLVAGFERARPRAFVSGPCGATGCQRSRGGSAYREALSDHCPVVLEWSGTP